MNGFLRTVRDEKVPSGGAAVWWLGQMGLMVKLGESVLCVDYFASDSPDRRVPPPVPVDEVTGVNVFLGTHDHLDHMDHAAWRVWAKNCPDAAFVFPRTHIASVLRDGVREENCFGMDDGETVKIGSVTIRAVAAAHEFLRRDPSSGTYPCLQYIIEGNGMRIYHAGDTLRYEGMLPKLRAIGPMDIALLPINGRDGERYRRDCIGNMTFQEAADLAGELRPGLVIPGHWDMFANNSADPEAFADYLDAKYGGEVPCLVPEAAKPIRISAACGIR
ncbi:MAG: MBL fold metallo-hydrolase [Clostridia bacterium]|nr:MBL fold metallo-hydrolase [Clostridia bacterium]